MYWYLPLRVIFGVVVGGNAFLFDGKTECDVEFDEDFVEDDNEWDTFLDELETFLDGKETNEGDFRRGLCLNEGANGLVRKNFGGGLLVVVGVFSSWWNEIHLINHIFLLIFKTLKLLKRVTW